MAIHNSLQSTRKRAYRRGGLRTRALSLGLCLIAGVTAGFAQKTCIPPARGVPGFTNARPNFYDSTQAAPDYQPNLNPLQPLDPRWVGSASQDYASGTLSDAQFLAESNVEGGQTVLYLSWYVKGGPAAQVTQTDTTLWAGFMPSGAATGTVIGITINGYSPTYDSNGEPLPMTSGPTTYAAVVYQGSGTTWSTVSTPTWVTATTRAWAKGTDPYNWAVEMRIPLDPTGTTGLNLGSSSPFPFSLWYSLQPDATISGTTGGVVPFTLPVSPMSNPTQYAVQLNASLTGPMFPDPLSWASFSIENPTSDPTCLTGIYLDDTQIGTNNTVSSSISLSTPNTFYANPYNYSSTAVGAGKLAATFNLANWGSAVGVLTPTSWTSPPTLTNASGGTTSIGAYTGTPPPPQANITGTWDLTGASNPSNPNFLLWCNFVGQSGVTDDTGTFIPGNAACPNAKPTQELHQCMFVSLTGPGLSFSRASAFRNMDFVGASVFKRSADISVSGLGPIRPGATHRDVYLFVETLNMPPTVSSTWTASFDRLAGEAGKRTPDTARSSLAGKPYSEIIQTVPVYIVRAYYDTGATLQLSSGKRIVLQPETSFGYFVIPHNNVKGWIHSLQGATQIGPNWYRISVANNIASKIVTTINPTEGGSGFTGWLGLSALTTILLLILILLIIAVIIYRVLKAA